ncbi:hypothetical protein NCCP2495_15400 [Dietzia sp. NCCP-2495]|uniref:hypothetical protein n=1 Tax=Dietzia sp. NCCP-2495 TaxID=2934675 RepID=UPI002230C1C7|nr:hypothetical protein [Dietzia sp. NCCP-2495]GLB63661.1 hypothetical protein NCCP2495_15400 [Dietzia sp. NCCP-2495]
MGERAAGRPGSVERLGPVERLGSVGRGVAERVRGVSQAYRDRYGRRARELALVLDGDNSGDDGEVTVSPWRLRLPRTVVVAAARSRGLEPVGGVPALVQRGPWLEPMRFAPDRNAGAR